MCDKFIVPRASRAPSLRIRGPICWVFRDVAFQDVGFENNSLKPLTDIISCRCEVPTPSVVEGQSTIMFKPHILKHHIPELPNLGARRQGRRWRDPGREGRRGREEGGGKGGEREGRLERVSRGCGAKVEVAMLHAHVLVTAINCNTHFICICICVYTYMYI